jgi:hypothetical protein
MNNRENNQADRGNRDAGLNRTERSSSIPNDLPDSKEDREKLSTEESFIDLPDVKDIPGQEFVNAPPVGMLGDTTISSDDEEGRSVFEADEISETRSGNEADVSRDERTALERADRPLSEDNLNLQRASLDNRDFDGERLNEKGFGQETSGSDLDMPGNAEETDSDDPSKDDEENKFYSLGSSDNESTDEGHPG